MSNNTNTGVSNSNSVKITFDEFIKMTNDDKKTLLRDIKINSIL